MTGEPLVCGSCSACCRGFNVAITADEAERFDHTRDGDRLLLRRDRFGRCIYLGPNGCTVYEHRPQICRDYDCRDPRRPAPSGMPARYQRVREELHQQALLEGLIGFLRRADPRHP